MQTLSSLKSAFNSQSDHLRIEVGFNSPFGFATTDQHIIPRALTDLIKKTLPSYSENAARNLIELPYNSDHAIVANLATQRGGHQPYNDYMEREVIEILDNYKASQSSDIPMTQEELAGKIGDLQDTMRCRHNRTKSDLVPNQLRLHSNDPNADMTSDLRTLAEQSNDLRASAEYTQRLHAHNLEHNPAYAALNDQASDPTAATSSRMKSPVQARAGFGDEPVVIDGGDDSCGGGGDGSDLPVPKRDEQPESDPSRLAMATGRYALEHPRLMGALATSAETTAALAAEGLPEAGATRGASLLPAVGSAAVTVGLAGVASVGIAHNAVADMASTTRIVSPQEAIPSLDQMHKSGGDIMGGRSHVNQIAIRFVGENATPEALYASAMEKHYTHAQGHLLLQKDGSLLRDDRFMRPYDQNPQIAAGRNADTLGIMVEGKSLTDAQRGTLTQVQDTFSARLANSAYGATQGAQLFGATYDEQMSLTQPQIAPHMLPQPTRRSNLSAGMGG